MAQQTQTVGVVGHTQFYADANLGNCNAGFHNSIYRGKNLGTSVTAAQYAQISAGTFDDMFIGDYWNITYNGTARVFRIAAFDYWLKCGDSNWNDGSGNYDVNKNSTHHVVIVPDSNIVNSISMNSTDITTGAYIGSDFYTGNNSNTGKADTIAIINGSFGSGHILNHREYFSNAVTSTIRKVTISDTDYNVATEVYESASAWYDSTVDLMNEEMVYGNSKFHNVLHGASYPRNHTIDKEQLPLFALDHSKICIGASWWLRDVASATSFCFVNSTGFANLYSASHASVIRPAFGIKA